MDYDTNICCAPDVYIVFGVDAAAVRCSELACAQARAGAAYRERGRPNGKPQNGEMSAPADAAFYLRRFPLE